MSKGMSNLIRMTHATQNNKIFMHVGENAKTKEITFSNDKDMIPCEITNYRTCEFLSFADMWEKITRIEKELNYHVFINATYLTYETGDTKTYGHE